MTALRGRPCWIFDLDGTLTQPVHDFDAIRAQLGIPRGELILEWLATQPPAVAAPLHDRLAHIEAELVEETVAQPGCASLLEALRSDGCRLGILTRNNRDNALRTLERIGVLHCFPEASVLGRDEAPAKPDPGGILRLLDAWGVAPHQAVMVGDYRLDLEAGRNAGVATAHFDPAAAFPWPDLTDVAVTTLPALLDHR
ncbi:MAG: HAD family hydrolase [Pseudomonadales bacterium]|jgi:HAD superfamily hydrolase (TIGR01509 family)|nr:HAD family hydrolase [Pseudomonadales bacterium]